MTKQVILLERPYKKEYSKVSSWLNDHWLVDPLRTELSDHYVSYWVAPVPFCLSAQYQWVGILSTHRNVESGLHIVKRLKTSPGNTHAYLLVEE